jgi:RNA polymerase sigma-70 factor (ECF subfamily)
VTDDWLARQFEGHREHLHAVAYRMLGSLAEADDAVQEAWLRLQRAAPADVANLRGWLTTVVARVCLDLLRARKTRQEEPLSVVLAEATTPGPEAEVLLADAVGLALLVVLDRLAPAERVAFVLHDLFDVPFDTIAGILDRSPAAVRQLASRGRRRVPGPVPPEGSGGRQHALVAAFLAASRAGDFGALLKLLDPDVVARAGAFQLTGASAVADQALVFARRSKYAQIMMINGMVGVIVAPRGRVATALTFTIDNDRITGLDVIEDPDRLSDLELAYWVGGYGP